MGWLLTYIIGLAASAWLGYRAVLYISVMQPESTRLVAWVMSAGALAWPMVAGFGATVCLLAFVMGCLPQGHWPRKR